MIVEVDGKETLVGSRTECALLGLLRNWGTDYNSIREAYNGSILKVGGAGAAWPPAMAAVRKRAGLRAAGGGLRVAGALQPRGPTP